MEIHENIFLSYVRNGINEITVTNNITWYQNTVGGIRERGNEMLKLYRA